MKYKLVWIITFENKAPNLSYQIHQRSLVFLSLRLIEHFFKISFK